MAYLLETVRKVSLEGIKKKFLTPRGISTILPKMSEKRLGRFLEIIFRCPQGE
jgi:hypothetical protein